MLQISQESTCVGVLFLAFRSETLLKRDSNTVFSCEISEIFKNSFFLKNIC